MSELKPGWTRVRFGDLAHHITDRVDNPSEAGVERYVGLEHLDSDSLTIRRWGTPDQVESTKLRFQPGDIIFGKRRAYQRKLAVADVEGICSAHAMVLRAKPGAVLPDFLPFFMQSDVFMERAQSISVGSLSPTINWKTLASEEFALPPLTEQQRLLQLIQSATQTIYELYNLNQVLKVLRGSLRVEYFEDKARHIRLIRDCVVNNGVQIGPFGAQLHQSDYSEEGVPVIMPQNMIDDKVLVDGIARVPLEIARRLSVHQVQVGDILLPRRGELDRRALITSENDGWLCGTGSVRIRLDPSIPSDLAVESLASRKSMMWLNANAVGTTMQNINTSIVESIPLSLPSSEAWAYASQLFGFVRSALSAVEVRREMAIKQIHKAVNGENSDAL